MYHLASSDGGFYGTSYAITIRYSIDTSSLTTIKQLLILSTKQRSQISPRMYLVVLLERTEALSHLLGFCGRPNRHKTLHAQISNKHVAGEKKWNHYYFWPSSYLFLLHNRCRWRFGCWGFLWRQSKSPPSFRLS